MVKIKPQKSPIFEYYSFLWIFSYVEYFIVQPEIKFAGGRVGEWASGRDAAPHCIIYSPAFPSFYKIFLRRREVGAKIYLLLLKVMTPEG